MYEVKIKVKISKKEKRFIKNTIMINLMKSMYTNLIDDISIDDRIIISYISNQDSYSTAVSLVAESFVQHVINTIVQDDVFNAEKERINEVVVKRVDETAALQMLSTGITPGERVDVTVHMGGIKFSRKISIQ